MNLSELTCKPMPAGTRPLSDKESGELLLQVPGWSRSGNVIKREYHFKDFHETMDFVNAVANIAHEQDHHPDMFVSYNRVTLTFSTHKIGGLSLNDFIMAARVDLGRGERVRGKAA